MAQEATLRTCLESAAGVKPVAISLRAAVGFQWRALFAH